MAQVQVGWPEDNVLPYDIAAVMDALRIMAVTVPRDGVVSAGMRGVAADWGPFHSRTKRTDMMKWTRAQPYCAGLARSLRPVARPEPERSPWEGVVSTRGE